MTESAKKPKPRRPGRPRLAKSVAKGAVIPVRFSPEDRTKVEAAAKASGQNVSTWVRSTLLAAIEG